MDRRPEHLTVDPSLRPEVISQESFDEWLEEVCTRLDDKGETELAKQLRSADYPQAIEMWMETLNPITSFNEMLYLRGHVELGERRAMAEQVQASIREGAIKQGMIEREPSEVQEFDLGEGE